MADWEPLAGVCPLTKGCLPVNIVSSLLAVFICIDKININKQECVASILLYSVDKFLFPLLVSNCSVCSCMYVFVCELLRNNNFSCLLMLWP